MPIRQHRESSTSRNERVTRADHEIAINSHYGGRAREINKDETRPSIRPLRARNYMPARFRRRAGARLTGSG